MYIYRFCLCYLVLSWDGEVSAVSRDAIEDVRHAQCDTVIDEWDEDFDRGKVRVENVIVWICFLNVKA